MPHSSNNRESSQLMVQNHRGEGWGGATEPDLGLLEHVKGFVSNLRMKGNL